MKKKDKENFHLIGVGGIGMSGLARFLMAGECHVTGSDSSSGGESLKLENEGLNVYRSHHPSNISDGKTTVVYSTAISGSNPEMEEAKRLGCRLWHRSDLLAHLMKSYQSITVTGTHGKTSTSALLSHILIVAKESPSYVIGGLIQPQNANSAVGKGRYFVAEADESDGSFLKYDSNYAIITNIEAEHLNHYKDLEDIKSVFGQFIEKVQDKEMLFWCGDCVNLSSLNPPGISYGFNAKADLRITNFKQKGWISLFDLSFQGRIYKDIQLSMIGKHNVLNAAATFGLCLALKISEEKIREALKSFKGVKRRAELIGKSSGIHIYDDYAHHPTEIECLLKGFRKAFPKRRIIALFQPHRYSRFIPFKDDFASSFRKASEVWVTDVFTAGETSEEPLNLNEYASLIESSSEVKASYVKAEDRKSFFEEHIKPHDILITIGAGDITKFAKEAFTLLEGRKVKMKLGLIKGSISHEHYISLVSSRFYEGSFDPDLYEMTLFKILPSGDWVIERGNQDTLISLEDAVKELLKCDCILLTTHGRQGEDGMLQGFLQTLKIPYTGPNYSLSSFNMNKIWMKLFVKEMGIAVPEGLSLSKDVFRQNTKGCLRRIERELSYPIVVKPASMGSTIGVTFVANQGELEKAIEVVLALDESAVIEERIFGRELEVSCLETEEGLRVTPPGEVRSDVRSYDYKAKYSSNPIEKIVNPDLDKKIVEKCQELAKKIYKAMQIKSYARLDFFLTRKNQLIFAEVNTQPGTTPRSLFQRTLIADGISSKNIIDQMVIDALYRGRLENRKSIQIRQFLKSIKDVTHK